MQAQLALKSLKFLYSAFLNSACIDGDIIVSSAIEAKNNLLMIELLLVIVADYQPHQSTSAMTLFRNSCVF